MEKHDRKLFWLYFSCGSQESQYGLDRQLAQPLGEHLPSPPQPSVPVSAEGVE